MDDTISFCEWMLRKRFGDGPLTEAVKEVAEAAPRELGRNSFLGLRLRVGENYSEPHMIHLYRLLYLYKNRTTDLDIFLRGVRDAIAQTRSE